MRMPFRDYVELLYRAYLEDEQIIQRLRDKIQDADYLKDLDDDPELQDWNEINPRAIDPRKRVRSKYYPSSVVDPQQGLRVFEDSGEYYRNKRISKIMKAARRRYQERRMSDDTNTRS